MKKEWKLLQRLLCLGLVLCMLLGLAACKEEPAPTVSTEPTVPTEPSENLSSSQPTQPSTNPPTVPTEPEDDGLPKVPTKGALRYELAQEHIDEFYRLLEESETLALAGEDMDLIETTTDRLDAYYEYMDAQLSIASVLHYSNTTDTKLEKQYLDTVDIVTKANDAYIQMARRVYMSDSPAKEMLFEDWTEQELAMLMAYEGKVADLQARNEEIKVAYRASEDDAEKIRLYVEMVQNNNEIAQVYGYDNYYEYAYELVYSRDYSSAELEHLRTFAKQYLLNTYANAIANFNTSYSALDQTGQANVAYFLYYDYDEISMNYVNQYLNYIPESMRKEMKQMLEKDSLFATNPNAMEGAFTTAIGERSYCFFGPGYASSTTVMHEGGHYYASRFTELNGIPLDLAEVHSQGNEWLFLQFISTKMSKSQYRALIDYSLYEDVAMLLVCLMVDEFEQMVYTTDVSNFTAADFDAIMNNIALQYFPDGSVASSLADMNGYWRLVVVDQPVYYVSYAVSSIAALDLYIQATENLDGAIEIYRKLCEEPLEDGGFLDNITAAGLSGPFHEDFYKKLDALIAARAS